jgi:hypothetical protein
MSAFARLAAGFFHRTTLSSPPPADPEPVYAQKRPVVGLFHSLTPEQKEMVMAYRGPENHGDPSFRLKASDR